MDPGRPSAPSLLPRPALRQARARDHARGAVVDAVRASRIGSPEPKSPCQKDDIVAVAVWSDFCAVAPSPELRVVVVLRARLESEDRTSVCLGLDVVEGSSDGDLDASVQLLDGDLSQWQQLGCV